MFGTSPIIDSEKGTLWPILVLGLNKSCQVQNPAASKNEEIYFLINLVTKEFPFSSVPIRE